MFRITLASIIFMYLSTNQVLAQPNACFEIDDDPQLCETKETLFAFEEGVLLAQKAADLGSPAKIYGYLRNNAEYVLYHGARSNSINSFLSLRGNDLDLASTLIAMFRSQGIRSRYVQGDIRITRAELANWLGVIDTGLAVSILRDQGIQNVDTTDPTYVTFQHVWVEALIRYDDYRGNGPNADSASCAAESDVCHWIALSPSFKQKEYQETYRLLLKDLNFDYYAYYNAQNPSSPDYVAGQKNKSPLEIFEEDALEYLRVNHPGITLEDVIDEGQIIVDRSGILPASLPFGVVGTVVRYNSVADHDFVEAVNWEKVVRSRVQIPWCPEFDLFPTISVPVVNLSTQKLTVTLFDDGSNLVFGYRLNKQPIGTTLIINSGVNLICGEVSQILQAGSLVDLILEIDVEPGNDPVEVTYNNLVLGGYYLIATGGETSNTTQIQRAFEELLAANDQYTIIVDETGSLGPEGVPYVDDGNGELDAGDTPLAKNLNAQDDLTGGLLYVAQALYYTRLREESARYSRLKGIVSPISAYTGVVSTDDQVEYLDDVPFAVTPGGLLIDLKGIRLNGSWEIDQPESYSSEAFRFLGHIGSSLEHEVWQEITGFDAISTVRGIQFAAEQSKPVLTVQNHGGINNFPDALTAMGFGHSAPGGFTQNDYPDLFGRNLVAWRYTGANPQAAFEIFRRDLTGFTNTDIPSSLITYRADNGIDGFFDSYDNAENNLQAAQASEGQLKTNIHFNSTDGFYQTYDILTASATNPSGFAVSSFNRTASDSYLYIINETAQHADGSYPVDIALEAADSNNTVTVSIGGLTGFQVINVTASSPAGFVVNSFNQVNADVWNVNFQQSAAQANGNYTVRLEFTLVANSQIYTGTFDVGVRIVSSRFVDQTATLTTGGIDVSDDQTISCPDSMGQLTDYTGPPTQLLVDLENCFNNVIAVEDAGVLVDFLDRNLGFDPAEYAFRSTHGVSIDQYDTDFVRDVQWDLYFTTGGHVEYVLPTHRPQDDFYLFNVYLKNLFDNNDNLFASTYAIVNKSNLLFGGGYVSAEQPIIPAESADFNNAVFTDTNVISVTNNDVIRTPSTADPVSTVTGNMYHDETDITIRGRGLDYAFTRTYNSNQTTQDGPLGFGWSHSYGMYLQSNDHGANPNYDSTQAPENDNGISSSITYTDERGGAHNYILNDDAAATRSIASNPPGEFDTLQLVTPSAGQHTLLFRNGVRYVFEETGMPLASNPNQMARLSYIEDPYGNRLSLSYDGNGYLINVVDNLGVAGRTGLTFTYIDDRIDTINDWSGRVWDFNYSPQGDLMEAINPLTHVMTYTYHGDTHLLHEIIHPANRNGKKRQMAFGYYENNQAYNYISALGETESLSYDLFRKRTRITDPRGARSEHYYDENGGLIKLIEKDQGISFFANNADGLRYSKTDALGFQTQYSYRADRSISADGSDNFGRVSREIDALDNYSDIDYGIYDQPTTVIDKRGNPTTRFYYQTTNPAIGAVAGRQQEIRATLNGTPNVLLESYSYYADETHPAFGNVQQRIEYIDPAQPVRQRITDYVYEPNGINLQTMTVRGSTSGGTITRTYGYDQLGRRQTDTLTRRSSPTDEIDISLTTIYGYDDLDRITTITDAQGNIHETVFDTNGKISEEKVHYFTDQPREHCNGPTDGYVICTYVTNKYDAADRLSKTTDILGHSTTFTYDGNGNLLTQTDANGHVTTFEYDAMNRRTARINANGHRTEMTYDLAGRLLATINANGHRTTRSYDALGRLETITTEEGRQTKFGYDAVNNQTHVTDANALADATHPRNSEGVSLFQQYDEFNRTTRTLDALDGETRHEYDLLGNITKITDAEGQITQFIYDDLGRLVQTIDPVIEAGSDKTEQVLLYDEAGNPLITRDRSGRERHLTYDRLNRLNQVEYLADNAEENYIFDPFGDLVTVSNSDGATYQYTYTARHELESKTDGRFNKTLTWFYDAVGNISTKIDYQGNITSYQYDSTNRLVALQNPEFLQVSYHYDPAGRLLDRILSNGAKTHYRYDDDNRLVQLINHAADNALVEDLNYQHDALGNITYIRDDVSGRTIDYDYDALYQLEVVDSSSDSEDRTYTYDKVGNRLSETRDGMTYYYCYHTTDCSQPPNGNRLVNIRTGSPTGPLYRQFKYEDSGRVTDKLDGAGNSIFSVSYNGKGRASTINGHQFAYDANDYRIRKDEMLYHLEGEHLEATYNSEGILQARYMRGVVIDEIVNAYHHQSSDPNDWTNYSFHHDHLNSVTALTGHNGTTEESTGYDAYGAPLNITIPGTGNRLLYTGREYDQSTRLYYYRARYYDPEIGRFISEDPLGFEAGVNFYAYVDNNPVNHNDPMGLINPAKAAELLAMGVQKIGGRFPRNAGLAGSVHPKTGIPFKTTGHPDFSGVAIAEVKIKQTGINHLDFAEANRMTKLPNTPKNYTWHHVEDGQTMQLVPSDIHASTAHTGGAAYVKAGAAGAAGATVVTNAEASDSGILGSGITVNDAVYFLFDLFIGIEEAGSQSDIPGVDTQPASGYTPSQSSFGGEAGGGFVLYPSKPNMNMLHSVYSK